MGAPYEIKGSTSHEEWLKSREGVLTATQIARLIVGGPAEYRQVRREFEGERTEFTSRYMEWGKEREPFIASFSNTFVDSRLVPNNQFLVSTIDDRIGATPDALSDGEVIGEFKTSKKPMPENLAESSDVLARRYFYQVQVQLFVTQAEACAFVWEQHDDDWELGPVPSTPVFQIIRPDTVAFNKIKDTVDKFHSEEQTDDVDRELLDDCLNRLREIRYERERLDGQEKVERARIREALGSAEGYAANNVSVSLFTPKPSRRFDKAAFKKAHPDLHDSFLVEGKSAGEPQLRVTFKEEG